jgi:hypothetical protein
VTGFFLADEDLDSDVTARSRHIQAAVPLFNVGGNRVRHDNDSYA